MHPRQATGRQSFDAYSGNLSPRKRGSDLFFFRYPTLAPSRQERGTKLPPRRIFDRWGHTLTARAQMETVKSLLSATSTRQKMNGVASALNCHRLGGVSTSKPFISPLGNDGPFGK
jgi:hypothetical protein